MRMIFRLVLHIMEFSVQHQGQFHQWIIWRNCRRRKQFSTMITCLNSVAWQGNLGTYHMQHKFNIFYHFASKIPQFKLCRQNKNKRLFQWQKKGTKKLLLGEKARALNAMIPVIFKGHFSVSSCFRHGTAASFPQAKELSTFLLITQ